MAAKRKAQIDRIVQGRAREGIICVDYFLHFGKSEGALLLRPKGRKETQVLQVTYT